ncbi:MAG: hypothetical protein Ta2G_18450 [Termitinemataceae bacterium]|nr:MAG: hypothetical protein Ta2G_18450 [Termitinemataceae bacterium]
MDLQIQAEKAWIIPYKVIKALSQTGQIKKNSAHFSSCAGSYVKCVLKSVENMTKYI